MDECLWEQGALVPRAGLRHLGVANLARLVDLAQVVPLARQRVAEHMAAHGGPQLSFFRAQALADRRPRGLTPKI